VDDGQFGVAGGDDVAVAQRTIVGGITIVAARPRMLRKRRVGPPRLNGRDPRDVIDVRVRHHHVLGAVRGRGRDCVEMGGESGAGIDQHGGTTRQQVGPVAGTGHRTRIRRVQGDDQ
jgi:hypothetical protein